MPVPPTLTAEAQRDPLRGTERSEIRTLLKQKIINLRDPNPCYISA
jgi:hypothetical protein